MIVGSPRGPVVVSNYAEPYLMETGEPAHAEAKAWFEKVGM